jgi:hypothetical protein
MSASRHLLAKQPANPAQVVCGVLGLTLIAAGLIGLAVDASWDTGSGIDGDELLGLEVNGWHNMVHVASGLLPLVGLGSNRRARSVCRLFGVVYLVVAIVGFADGDDILGLFPVNTADNGLHIVLAIVALWAAAISKDRRDQVGRDRAAVAPPDDPTRVVGPGSGHVGGPRASAPRIDRRLPPQGARKAPTP